MATKTAIETLDIETLEKGIKKVEELKGFLKGIEVPVEYRFLLNASVKSYGESLESTLQDYQSLKET